MVKRSKLLSALDEHQNVDHEKERQKKLQQQATKRKRSKNQQNGAGEHSQASGAKPFMSGSLPIKGDEEPNWKDESDSEAGTTPALGTSTREMGSAFQLRSALKSTPIDGSTKDTNEAHSETPAIDESSQQIDRESEEDQAEDSPDPEAEEGIPLSDIESLSSDQKGDIIPHQRLTINNTTALTKAYNSITLRLASLPFSEHQTITSSTPISIPDVNDDLNRELVFHQQCLTAAKKARDMLRKEGVRFSRPPDYFAEMIKSDEHMGKIKQKMTDEAANKKAAAEARKLRDLKKFGKQVQVAKLQERDKAKRETLDKINILKRKRKNTETGGPEETDMFDVALEDASKADKSSRRARTSEGGRGPNKRQKKDAKFGFGGKKRFAKSGDAVSSSDMRGFSTQQMKGQKKGAQRLGKSRRAKKL